MSLRTLLSALAAAALLLPAGAWAQDDMTDMDETDTVVVVSPDDERATVQDRGVEVQAIGGVRGFTGDASDFLQTGPAYGVVAAIEPFSALSLELGYQGASYLTDSALAGVQNRVNQNGGYATIKISPVIGIVEPYAFGGFGLSQLTATGAGNVFVQDDTIYSIPVGLTTDVLLGVRGTYDFGYGVDAFPAIDDTNANWLQGTVNAGFQF